MVGTVGDANTGTGLNGPPCAAFRTAAPTAAFATPEDPSQGDGFYVLFSESGAQSFEASFAAHDPQTKSRTVIPNAPTRLDFSLAAGLLEAARARCRLRRSRRRQDLALTLANTGTGAPAS